MDDPKLEKLVHELVLLVDKIHQIVGKHRMRMSTAEYTEPLPPEAGGTITVADELGNDVEVELSISPGKVLSVLKEIDKNNASVAYELMRIHAPGHITVQFGNGWDMLKGLINEFEKSPTPTTNNIPSVHHRGDEPLEH